VQFGPYRTKVVQRFAAHLLERRVPSDGSLRTQRIGSDYGGWEVPADALHPGCRCYCAGVGEDATLETGLADQWRCEVWSFDPTPAAMTYMRDQIQPREHLHFVPVGIWSEDATLYFGPPSNPDHVSHSALRSSAGGFEAECRSIRSLAMELGHESIDLLKLDIEGAEWVVLPELLTNGPLPRILCFELHFDAEHRARDALRLVDDYRSAGYQLIAVDRQNVTLIRELP
jgi:FkbM family methyltransferase